MKSLFTFLALMFLLHPSQRLEADPDQSEFEWAGPFFFMQMADCQLGMMEDNESWDREVQLLEAAVEQINRLRPRFVVMCGDMTHATPEEPAYPEQVLDYKRVMQQVDPDIPLVCVCGNHDVGNRPTPGSIEIYRENYGEDFFSFWVSGVEFFVLNSSLIFDPSGYPEHYERQEQWLNLVLDWHLLLQPVHRIAFLHHPIFLESPDEEDDYFNLPMERREPLLKRLFQGGVTACFAGHYHRNAHGLYGDMEMVTTSALGMPLGEDASGLRVVWVHLDRLDHQYVTLDELAQVDISQSLEP